MAKRKSESAVPSRINRLLEAAKGAHKKDVGAGGSIYDPYLSSVRSIRFPCLAFMDMLGYTGLRDSCTILIDGAPGSHKSSLAIELFNWGLPYAIAGAIIDCENKAAVDIANGTLSEPLLWFGTETIRQIEFRTSPSVEATQSLLKDYVGQCRAINYEIPRDDQTPFMVLVDPLAGTVTEETKKAIKKLGYVDRGHAGRAEALLWSQYLKDHEADIIDLPFVSIFVNHVKTRQKQVGAMTRDEQYNPGGCSQNYATTIALRCSASAPKHSEAFGGKSYAEVHIKCVKNSRGPTNKRMTVRKYTQQREDGITMFWWDWGRATAEYLAEAKTGNPIKDICAVIKHNNNSFSCPTAGLSKVTPTEIGNAVMSDDKLRTELIKALRFRQLTEFTPVTKEDAEYMERIARKNHLAYLEKAGMTETAAIISTHNDLRQTEDEGEYVEAAVEEDLDDESET